MKAQEQRGNVLITLTWRDIFRLAFAGDTPTVWRRDEVKDIRIQGPRSRFIHIRTTCHLEKSDEQFNAARP